MAPLVDLQHANNRTLKKSFTTVTISSPPSPGRTAVSSAAEAQGRKLRHCVDGALAQAWGVRGLELQYPVKMPSAAGTRMYGTHIPSFMSVYDMETVVESPDLSPAPKLSGTKYEPQPATRPQQSHTNEMQQSQSQIHSHQHRESTSTQTSDSTESSPTTTISTVDSSSLSDPSPSSSPESPITLVPLSSFSGSTFGLDTFQSLKMADNPNQLPLNDNRPMTSPLPRKPKNPKALALNLNSNSDAFQASEPSSPSFIKPPANPPRKKPSLLSLNTGAANSVPILVESLASPRMPTMLQRRSLKHSVSSPQIISTPGFGPTGGMTLGGGKSFGPSRFKESNIATNTFTISEDADLEAPSGVQMATRVPGVTVGGDSFDRPHSGEDAKSPSYPEGPILMHEPSVHLYLEPKPEEAMKFDVIINVAREVKNPFKALEEKAKEKLRSRSLFGASSPSDIGEVEPDTAATMMSFKTAFEVQPPSSTESSPTTPKPSVETKLPEYIHVPWDHNTDVKDELWDLCQTIESRTKEGKRVLVHCQQGASRSATLIIAYGMYINQNLGATEAYALAQAKSRWVNPNMSLLFSLNDFKKVIDKKNAEKETALQKPQSKHRPTLSADAVQLPSTPSRARGNSTPSVAARDEAVTKFEERKEPATEPQASRFADFDFGFGDKSSKQEVTPPQRHEESDWEALMSPRVEEMTANPLQNFSRSFGSGTDSEAPPTPGLFSPRVFEFPRSSFFPSPGQRMSLAVDEDPRSPPTKGEAPITRSIDDFL
jgi:tyrosine-protein phosphatase MSG5